MPAAASRRPETPFAACVSNPCMIGERSMGHTGGNSSEVQGARFVVPCIQEVHPGSFL
jgi:hypothetical protein